MSEPWTPTTDDFRQVWGAFNEYGGLVDRPHSVTTEEAYAAFYAWLAEMVRAARADGWRECAAAIQDGLGAWDALEHGPEEARDVDQ